MSEVFNVYFLQFDMVGGTYTLFIFNFCSITFLLRLYIVKNGEHTNVQSFMRKLLCGLSFCLSGLVTWLNLIGRTIRLPKMNTYSLHYGDVRANSWIIILARTGPQSSREVSSVRYNVLLLTRSIIEKNDICNINDYNLVQCDLDNNTVLHDSPRHQYEDNC